MIGNIIFEALMLLGALAWANAIFYIMRVPEEDKEKLKKAYWQNKRNIKIHIIISCFIIVQFVFILFVK